MTKKANQKIWWDLVCDLTPDINIINILSNDFMPDNLWIEYVQNRDASIRTRSFSAMTAEEIFMAMCFLSYIYDPKE